MSTIAVLAGGLSLEREVSLRSGRRVSEALGDAGHRVATLDLDAQLVTALVDGAFDAIFLALHGRAGEDGTVQSLLSLLGIPYTGAGPTGSSLAWDKAVTKGLWRRAGLSTAPWIAMSSDAIRGMGAAHAFDQVVEGIGLPLVVKPAQGGGAMGVRTVDSAADLGPALVAALSYHDVVVIEAHIAGTEVAVSLVDDHVLPVVEIVATRGPYDFATRYSHGAADFYAPARLDDAVRRRCQEAARAAVDVLGARHVARTDMIVDTDGTPWLLETDTCPGLTETSLLPMAAHAEGWTFAELCQRILTRALREPRSLSISS